MAAHATAMPALPPEAMTTPAAGIAFDRIRLNMPRALKLPPTCRCSSLSQSSTQSMPSWPPSMRSSGVRRMSARCVARPLRCRRGRCRASITGAEVAQSLYCTDGHGRRPLRARARDGARARPHQHRQPGIEPPADRAHPRRAGPPRRREPADLRRRPEEGQPVRDARRGQAGRRDRLRPHRHRAVGRPGLVRRSARRGGAATAACTAAAAPT